jgi:hypothetical protein
MRERSAGKLARAVLRGPGGRESTWLPGGSTSRTAATSRVCNRPGAGIRRNSDQSSDSVKHSSPARLRDLLETHIAAKTTGNFDVKFAAASLRRSGAGVGYSGRTIGGIGS